MNELGNRLVEVKVGVAALRSVHLSLMQLAYKLADRPETQGFLVLLDPEVTRDRLQKEWKILSAILRPNLRDRITICLKEGNSFVGIPHDPDRETQSFLIKEVAADGRQTNSRIARADYSFVVLQILIDQWLLGRGPMTISQLKDAAGCSYPTVANVISHLGHYLIRHTDRRIELRSFPREDWAHMVAISEKARGTTRFADRSGQPRSPESLLHRLQRHHRRDVAIGGVWGAKYYYPALDIVGNPRLDLSVHCPPAKGADLSFIERLDPALSRTNLRDEPATLIVHLVRRAEPLFSPREEAIVWADPVECLLDLHEARLEPQAAEFLNSFPAVKDKL